jgi:hypothetical protein
MMEGERGVVLLPTKLDTILVEGGWRVGQIFKSANEVMSIIRIGGGCSGG